jgi:ornithine cyclodeaminase/alanine dehydrogenase-like protein (mu-crystallin family)
LTTAAPVYLDEARIEALLEWDPLIDAMERALVAFSTGGAIQPVRSVLAVEEGRRYFGVMPAVAGDVMGAKLVSFYPVNENAGVPTHHATIVLFDARTGVPTAAMDGRLITEMRTAAVSAAVARRLMPQDSHVLALLGSGVQARAHLRALRRVARFDDVRVWSRTPEHAGRFAREHGARDADAAGAVAGADVVVVATSAHEPVLAGEWLKPGALAIAVGANHPTWRELDDTAMRNALIVDSREAAARESGDLIRSGARVYAEAGEILAGLIGPPPAGQTRIFKSLGLAIEDLYAARLVLAADAASQGSTTRPLGAEG